ncbi:uncharacterized protein LOC110854658 [Folsomia candida]|uniref:uncharacterized protein LOC110854658 n=1 Tax=Folsomia candida TaxID=158441 RepID=UPI000B903E9D|nr:uncharacterized protein LOC110854658 [Folsomia candida]
MRLAYFSVPIFLVLTVILGRAELGNSANTVELMGVVANVSTCGGAGNSIQLRISGCEGYCQLLPGQEYECEEDFMPSEAADSLSLRLEICHRGACFIYLSAEIPNSSVVPGLVYTAKYSITPTEMFTGQTVRFYAFIFHTDNSIMETCISAFVDIL